jgi:hypothetical protein
LALELETLRERKRRLDSVVDTLQSLLQFNREMVEGTHADLFDRLSTDALAGTLDGNEAVCWSCGSSVETDRFDEMLDRLQEAYRDAREERTAITDELEDVQDRTRERERQRDEREALRESIEAIETELDQRRRRRSELEARETDLETRVAALEAEVDSRREADEQAVVERHERVSDLEFELGRLAEQRMDVVAEIEDIEADLEHEGDLRDRRETVSADLDAQRTRIDRLEADVIESFNEHMENVLALLDYENLDRIWIERRRDDDPYGVTRSVFDLHIVRSTTDGTTYEDTVSHLSESEREVTGLTFALAGFLAHEVAEDVPFILLDSLEAVDSARIAALVEYFEEHADYLVVALLHEDAQALDEAYPRVTEI